jgi:hypothetical protein
MKINSEIIFRFLFDQKRSILADLRPKTGYFKTSFKNTYFNKVFGSYLLSTRQRISVGLNFSTHSKNFTTHSKNFTAHFTFQHIF